MLELSAVSVVVAVVGFVVAVGAAAVWLRSEIGKQRNSELSHLVDARGERIGDLEGKVKRQDERIADLEGKYNHLLEMFESDMAMKIAAVVVQHIEEKV